MTLLNMNAENPLRVYFYERINDVIAKDPHENVRRMSFKAGISYGSFRNIAKGERINTRLARNLYSLLCKYFQVDNVISKEEDRLYLITNCKNCPLNEEEIGLFRDRCKEVKRKVISLKMDGVQVHSILASCGINWNHWRSIKSMDHSKGGFEILNKMEEYLDSLPRKFN